MGLLRSKPEPPVEPPAGLRNDVAERIREAPPKEGRRLVRPDLLNYLQERLPSDEICEAVTVCCAAGYGSPGGILLLTDRRVITLTRDDDNSPKLTAVALTFKEITDLSYGPSKTVNSYAVRLSYPGGSHDIYVGLDDRYSLMVLEAIHEKINSFGQHAI